MSLKCFASVGMLTHPTHRPAYGPFIAMSSFKWMQEVLRLCTRNGPSAILCTTANSVRQQATLLRVPIRGHEQLTRRDVSTMF